MRPTLSLLSKSGSSKQWLSRQARDPFVKARASSPSSYRARSAFKLLELDKKHKIFGSHTKIVFDLGAAPGGWSQVAAEALGLLDRKRISTHNEHLTEEETISAIISSSKDGEWSSGVVRQDTEIQELKDKKMIIAIDLLPIVPISGVRTVRQDFLDGGAELIASLLPTPDTKADVLLSDIAPNMSGNKTRDMASGMEVCEAVYRFASQHLRVGENNGINGGTLVLKHFASELTRSFFSNTLKPNFHRAMIVKPDASRNESSEYYFVAKGYKGDKSKADSTS